ncbi:MAG: AIR synthase related protein [Candidatus Altiarchaeota archaeon]
MAKSDISHDIARSIEHIGETNKLRKMFWRMDEKVLKLKYGIQQGDDCVVIGKTVINMEGPYPVKTGRKTGLIHTCSDVVVMGGRPLYAFDSMQVDSISESEEISRDLKKQSDGLKVPIVGGNMQMEAGLKPCISFTVVGELVGKPIPDSDCRSDDRLLMLGQILDGDIGERVYRANVKFETFLELVKKKIEIHAAKDASRGGWFGNLTEMLVKSKKGAVVTSIPYPRLSRYMGSYILSVPKREIPKIVDIAAKHRCPVVEMGNVKDELNIKLGGKVVVTKKKMNDLIRKTPYRKAKE